MPAVNPAKFTSLDTLRHSAAHILAAAVMELWPEAKLGVGPVIETGFYYDLDLPQQLGPQDLLRLQKRMDQIISRNEEFVREELPIDEAIALFQQMGQTYKVELLTDLKTKGSTAVGEEGEGMFDGAEKATVYRTGKFVDLCRGPHVARSKEVGAIKLRSIAGAYWRGKDTNPQLQRVYGTAFATKEELDAWVTQQEEAEKRDHRKLGKELELFALVSEIGPGLPLFYPKGAVLRRLVEGYITEEQEKRGYVPIWIPHITRGELYKQSGHLDKYDAMYSPMHIDDEAYYLKPMNCPHFMMLYKTVPHSYRELPLRYTCTTTNYRYEKSGELSGLTRVRALTQDDCHVFCTPDQIENEIRLMLEMIGNAYQAFGLKEFWVRISLRDSQNKGKYLGSEEVWETAEGALRSLVKGTGWKYQEAEDEAAFYGPKLDFMVKDAIGREWQLSTIQLDFNLPERFELEYAAAGGDKQRPVVIHRAILGSTERFMGILIEHFAGAFPVWLSPVQLQVVPVAEKHLELGQKLAAMLKAEGVRVECDESNESVGYKIRKAAKAKVPYMVVVGDKEQDLANFSVRIRGKEVEEQMTYAQLVAAVREATTQRKLEI